MTSGPKTGSCATPMMTSVPPVIIGWSSTWRSRGPNLLVSRRQARRISSSVRRSSWTAPASVLCSRPGTSALSTTGPPMPAAARTASSALETGVSSVSRMP